jgi:hypothetical protein
MWTNPNWRQFAGSGLPDQDETYKDLYFVDEQTGYIGGRHLTLLDSKVLIQSIFKYRSSI